METLPPVTPIQAPNKQDLPSTPPSFLVTPETRYDHWYETKEGAFALEHKEKLLRRLLTAWVRRSRSMLVISAGTGVFLETLWESGFDVTAQEQMPHLLSKARSRLGNRSDFSLGAPDELPFEDCSFDYAVAIDALEFWEDPKTVLEEMNRVACGGVILMFSNAWSLFGLHCRLASKDLAYRSMLAYLQSPYHIHKLLKKIFGQAKMEWRATLVSPISAWRPFPVLDTINALEIRLPPGGFMGGFIGVRIDFGHIATGNPLALRTRQAVLTRPGA